MSQNYHNTFQRFTSTGTQRRKLTSIGYSKETASWWCFQYLCRISFMRKVNRPLTNWWLSFFEWSVTYFEWDPNDDLDDTWEASIIVPHDLNVITLWCIRVQSRNIRATLNQRLYLYQFASALLQRFRSVNDESFVFPSFPLKSLCVCHCRDRMLRIDHQGMTSSLHYE